jgi:alpha-ribazole phosphatase
MRVCLIRHTRPLIERGICYGRLDIPLDPTGQSYMEELATAGILENSKRVWTSPARRCQGLADEIARNLSIPKVIDHRLQELDFGAWEGKTWNDVARSDLDDWAANPETFRPPGGESGAELVARCRSFFEEVHRTGDDCAVVSHGGPLVVLHALCLGRPVDLLAFKQPVGSINGMEGHALTAPAPPAGS